MEIRTPPLPSPLRRRAKAAAVPEAVVARSGKDRAEVPAQLVSSQDDLKAMQKEMASRKIDQLRERARALAMLGGDPQALTRALAQLAREIAGAVKEYREAGGTKSAGNDVTGLAAAASAEAGPEPGSADAAAPATPLAADPYRQQQARARAEQLETTGLQNGDFVQRARGLIRKLKDLLDAASRGADGGSRQGKDAGRARRDFRDAEKLLDGIDGEAKGATMMGKLLSLDA